MIKENRVSLWLGVFENRDELKKYVDISFDEDGNIIKSLFQEIYGIESYDLDSIETDWIEEGCAGIESLLAGFSYDDEIIPKFKELIGKRELSKYNSIVLLYYFEYDTDEQSADEFEFIGCVDYQGK